MGQQCRTAFIESDGQRLIRLHLLNDGRSDDNGFFFYIDLIVIERDLCLECFDIDGLIRIGQRCGGWGRMFSALRIIPRPIRNWLYVRVARNRYRLFGKGDICALPDPALRARLIG